MKSFIVDIIGEFGLFHFQAIFVLCILKMPLQWAMTILRFTSPYLDENNFYCELTNDYNPITKCYLPNGRPCPNFIFKREFEFISLTEDKQMVCERKYLFMLFGMSPFFGNFLGTLIGSNIWHLISPRTLILGCIWLYSAFCILAGFFYTILQHIVFSCLMGFVGSMLSSSCHIISEITTERTRIPCMVVLESILPFSEIFLANFAIYLNDWSYFYSFIGVCTLSMYLVKDTLPEAPGWLLRKGNIKEVKKFILKATKVNKRTNEIPANLDQKLEDLANIYISSPTTRYIDLWKGKEILTLILAHFANALYAICYSGYNSVYKMIKPIRFNLFTVMLSFADIVGCVLAYFVAKSYSRADKWIILALFTVFGGCFCFWAPQIPKEDINMHDFYAWTVVTCVPKACIAFGRVLLQASLTDFTVSQFYKNFVFSCIILSKFALALNPVICFFAANTPDKAMAIFGFLQIVGGSMIFFMRIPTETHSEHNDSDEGLNITKTSESTASKTLSINIKLSSDIDQNERVSKTTLS